MEPFHENRFIDALNRKEEWAFKALYKEFYPRLCIFARKYLQNEEEIEDAVLESFVSFWRTAQCNDSNHVKSYLYTIVKNRCLKLIASQQRRDVVLINLKTMVDRSDEATAFKAMVTAEILGQLHRDVNELPLECAKVCRMIFFEGMSIGDVARILGLASSTVKTQKSRGIKYLENKYKGKPPLFLPMMIAM